MDLPTYTNIWRIEKRLYKLYDLRLPMPLPLVQIGVFVGVFVPWVLLLMLIGVPLKTPWHVLYLVPPGVLTWLATDPEIARHSGAYFDKRERKQAADLARDDWLAARLYDESRTMVGLA